MTDLMLGQWASLPQEELEKRLVEEGDKLFGHRAPGKKSSKQGLRPTSPASSSLSPLSRVLYLASKIGAGFYPTSLFSRLRKTS